MIKGIIFDVDGTTLSTLYDIQDSLNVVLKKHHYPEQNYDAVRLGIGNGFKKLVKSCLPSDTKEEEIEQIANEYISYYGEHYNEKTKPYDGIVELLQELENRGIILAINSNKPIEYCKNLMEYHFPGKHFIAIIGSRKGVPNKPDPCSANEIVELMKLDKSEVLYVGDSDCDINTAKNAGLKSVGCLWGFRDIKTLKEAGADIIIKEPKELLNYL